MPSRSPLFLAPRFGEGQKKGGSGEAGLLLRIAVTMAYGGQLATARWADPDYISDKYYYTPGDFWIGRNPHNFEQAIGWNGQGHVLLTAGTRGGKGRSIIINNLALWPGSTVTYDPKGEIPAIIAARRGSGDDLCEGMGQDVFVLDPLRKTDVGPDMLAYFNPLSIFSENMRGADDAGELDSVFENDWQDSDDDNWYEQEKHDPDVFSWAKRLARSMVKVEKGTESGEWSKKAIQYISLVISHVVTSPDYEDKDRNLYTVLALITEGAEDVAEALKRANPDENPNAFDAYDLLIDEIERNQACGGWIARKARAVRRSADKTPKYFESIRSEATEKLDWMISRKMRRSLVGWDDTSRNFDPTRLKTDKKGISVFIILELDDLETYEPWIQTIMLAIFAGMRQVQTAPASGHDVLCFLDEFSSLQRQDYIVNALDTIAGAGMKLCTIVQNIDTLQELYGKRWASFISNAGLQIYFDDIGPEGKKFIKESLGETEVTFYTRSVSKTDTFTENQSRAIAKGRTEGHTDSIAIAEGYSDAHGMTEGSNWSRAVNWSDAKNWGKSDGRNMGENYGPHIFWQGFERSKNYGTNLNKSRGGSHTKGGSKTKGGSRSESRTHTDNYNETKTSSWQHSLTETNTDTYGIAKAKAQGATITEQVQKKPLLDMHECDAYLATVDDKDCDHEAYPGLALVKIKSDPVPFFVRRSHYDQDEYFKGCFSKHPKYGFVPIERQRLLGYQYTPDHILEINFPKEMQDNDAYEVTPLLRRFQRFRRGEDLFSFKPDDYAQRRIHAPFSGRVMAVETQPNHILTIKADNPFSDEERKQFHDMIFGSHVKRIIDARTEAEKEEARKKALEAKQNEEKQACIDLRKEIVDLNDKIASWRERTQPEWHVFFSERIAWLYFVIPLLISFVNTEQAEGFLGSVGVFIISLISFGFIGVCITAAYIAFYEFVFKEHFEVIHDLETKVDELKEKDDETRSAYRSKYGEYPPTS